MNMGSTGWQSYRFDEIENAPPAIGLYAWYGILNAGPMDWKDQPNQQLSGENGLRNALLRHSKRFRPQELATYARRNWHNWKGRLKDDKFQKFLEMLGRTGDAVNYDNQHAADLDEMDRETLDFALRSDESRGALVRILAAATPVLSAPIYVGQSDNLQRRLRDHKSTFLSLRSLQFEDDWSQNLAQERELDKVFASRAVRAGFTSENLIVFVLNIDALLSQQGDAGVNRKQITKAAEILINNWNRPVLGKR